MAIDGGISRWEIRVGDIDDFLGLSSKFYEMMIFGKLFKKKHRLGRIIYIGRFLRKSRKCYFIIRGW